MSTGAAQPLQSDHQQYLVTLLRHGESEGNLAGVIQGQMDLPLTPGGRRQAQALGERWKAQGVVFDWVIASPLLRARQTAEIVADALGLEVALDPVWIERGFGQGEGQSPDVLRAATPVADFYHPYQPVAEGAETSIEVYQRALHGLLHLMRRPAGRYLIVSHGALLNMINFAIMGIAPQGHYNSPRFRFGNTAYATWSYRTDTRQWYLLGFVNPEEWTAKEAVDKV
ncbi:MAG: histidine phosphatase family protein [Chloroflexota bacterium]